MTKITSARIGIFTMGILMLVSGAIALPLTQARAPHLLAVRSFDELATWMFGGLGAALASLFLLTFGAGWKRLVLLACSLVELYFWGRFIAVLLQAK